MKKMSPAALRKLAQALKTEKIVTITHRFIKDGEVAGEVDILRGRISHIEALTYVGERDEFTITATLRPLFSGWLNLLDPNAKLPAKRRSNKSNEQQS